MLVATLLLILSVFLLWKGADLLVDSASRLGRRFRLSDLTIGLTIVAFGTSAPEFAVTISAVFSGHAEVSVGNIVGSNIFNLGFVLGGCALFSGLRVDRLAVRRDGTLLVVSSLLLLWILGDQRLAVWEGAVLLAGLVAYLMLLARNKEGGDRQLPGREARRRDLLYLLLAMVAIGGGGHLLVISASQIARALGLSEWVIAVTVVGAGTSAPEVAASLVAAARGRHGMSIGNLVGSDLFNILGVLGLAGVLGPLTVGADAWPSLLLLVGMCVLVVIFMRTGWRVTRWEGAALILIAAVRWLFDLAG